MAFATDFECCMAMWQKPCGGSARALRRKPPRFVSRRVPRRPAALANISQIRIGWTTTTQGGASDKANH